MGWRHIFEPGSRYRVRADFRDAWLGHDPRYTLRAGEVLVFELGQYSYYDNDSHFLFRGASGEERYWRLHDDTPQETWREFFERVSDDDA